MTNGKSNFIRDVVLVAIFTASIVGCSSSTTGDGLKSVAKECVLLDEQANSLTGRWDSIPIKISFKAGDWNTNEIAEVKAAANVWNSFFQAAQGITVFDTGPDGSGYQSSQEQTGINCNNPSSSSTDSTVLYKRTDWTKGEHRVALTSFCSSLATGGSPLPKMTKAIMEFNYSDFFISKSGQYPDLQSIALHELGHLLGLDHSCGSLSQNKASLYNVACPDSKSEPDNFLVRTVMYPVVGFDGNGNGEVKQDLTVNDQQRANCLYGAKAL